MWVVIQDGREVFRSIYHEKAESNFLIRLNSLTELYATTYSSDLKPNEAAAKRLQLKEIEK